jgi:hypothetical protein
MHGSRADEKDERMPVVYTSMAVRNKCVKNARCGTHCLVLIGLDWSEEEADLSACLVCIELLSRLVKERCGR